MTDRSEDSKPTASQGSESTDSRRRLLGAGVVATPILATLSARPVFGNALSGDSSGDHSVTDATTTGGFGTEEWADASSKSNWQIAGFDYGVPGMPSSGSSVHSALGNGDTRSMREVLSAEPEAEVSILLTGILNASFFEAQPALADYIVSVKDFHLINSGKMPHPAPYDGLAHMIRSQFS